MKITMRYHLTPLRMAITKSTNTCWRGCAENGALLVGKQIGAAPVENSMEVPQKIKSRPNDPAIILPGIYSKKCKTINQKDTCALLFIAALFLNSQDGSNLASINRQMNKQDFLHTHNGILLSCKMLPFATRWVGLEGIMLSNISQRQIL